MNILTVLTYYRPHTSGLTIYAERLVAIPTARFSGIYVLVLTLGLQITLERTLFSFPWIIESHCRESCRFGD